MTRSAQVTQALTAMRKARAAPSARSVPAPMRFRVFEDNGGGYHWTIFADSGENLVQSASFASYEEARQAASRIVREVASAAPLEEPGAPAPVDLIARGDAASTREDGDEARWLDEGGRFISDALRP